MSQHTHKEKIAELRDVADFIGPNTAEREHAQRLLREWAGQLETEEFRALAEVLKASGIACGHESPNISAGIDPEVLIFHCNSPAGHDGDHQILITWPKEE